MNFKSLMSRRSLMILLPLGAALLGGLIWLLYLPNVKVEKYELKIRFHVPNGFFLYHDKTTIDLTQLAGLVQLQKKAFHVSNTE